MSKVVAFLDILGFGNHTNANVEEALELLSNYETIVSQKINDKNINPPESYEDDGLKELAKQRMVDSFEYFLPFSDSLIIQSSVPNVFLPQVSRFLLDC